MTATAAELPAPWGEHELPGDEPVSVRVGPMRLHLRVRDDELWIAHQPGRGFRGLEEASVESEEPEGAADLEWSRWPLSEAPESVHLGPLLPPRTLVAQPEVPFRLQPGVQLRVFVRVPLWVGVALPGAESAPLAELPTVLLSDTWWGTTREGELCYWLGTTARRRMTPELFASHRIVCPLRLANRSSEELPVERMALRGAHLGVFSDQGRFWADETRVRFRGTDDGSDVHVEGRPPAEAPEAVRVAAPREKAPARGFSARSFARFITHGGI